MAFDRFMIAPISGGQQTNVKPFLIPDDAFEQMLNAYIFRGRIRKRFGARLLNEGLDNSIIQLGSRVRLQIGTTDASGNLALTSLPSSGSVNSVLNVGAAFSAGNIIFTVTTVPTVVGNSATLTTDPGTTGTVRLNSTGPNVYQFQISGGNTAIASTAVYWYPATPIMGLIMYQSVDSLQDPTFAFDMQFAYQYVNGAWQQLGTAMWSGTDSQFFWGDNWRGSTSSDRLLFVTNGNQVDGIKYWDGTTWSVLNPQVDASGNTLDSCRMLVVYQNRLVALNTIESSGTYTNRARWAAFGDPTAVNAWRSDIPGNGNSIDADTNEDIVSCCFVKDRLVVFFERSTWALVYTANQAQPFTWQRINIELGADATFSAVPFDKIALAIGNVGVHACNGVNVERIDEKIPDSVWEIHTGSEAVNRVHGIRDYFAEQVYWTFPNNDTNSFNNTFPNKVLVYNYKTGSWAFNTDSITAFGYYYAASQSAITWDSMDTTWDNTQVTWDSGVTQQLNQEIIAGNQQGYIFICDSFETKNSPSLQVTNIQNSSGNVLLTVINHNLDVSTTGSGGSDEGDYIYLENINGLGVVDRVYPVIAVVNSNSIIVYAPDILVSLVSGNIYEGGATITRVSRIDVYTKQFNLYLSQDRNSYIQKVDFLVDRTDSGEISIDYLLGSSPDGNTQSAIETDTILGTGVLETTPYDLYPIESTQDRLWHPVYLQGDSNGIQIRMYLSDDQLLDFDIATSAFQMHAMCLYAMPTASRLQ